ncbi:MAG: sulfatase-like hydrolase/transferase [Sedimentisphaerales bacterium]|nr:sulfatase-like hydrolase/transferase [Sedimentisphaerales bacterium]
MKRRDFLKAIGAGSAFITLPYIYARQSSGKDSRPNILWIMTEDISPDLSCYGTPAVQTPNLDKLADQGVRFTNAFTTSPVCSTSRSAMITGMHQSSIGAHHHRSHRGDGYVLPEPVKPITEYLRQAGYFTANVKTAAQDVRGSGKTDFNFRLDNAFDGDDWNQRHIDQPFFAQLSISITHRGRQWDGLEKKLENPVNPKKVKLPPYFPDHPIARKDWATYLNSIQMLDIYIGKILQRLESDGLADNTMVIFIGDHGRCHVRSKQWLYDAGIRIPLIVRWPGKLKPGHVNSDLVSAIDISATILKIAGIQPPKYMQGRIFIGSDATKRDYIFASRDRCDETIECIRCVHDKRYSYIRNYMSYRPWMALNLYKDTGYPVRNLLRKLHAEGKLTTAQTKFMAPTKPPEELYDLENDPHELNNLADSPEHRNILKRMRAAHINWMHQIGDTGLIPEPELEEMYLRHGKSYNNMAQPENQNLINRIREIIEISEQGKSAIPQLIHAMQDNRPSVRFWAAIGLGNMNSDAEPARIVLQQALHDKSASVRIAAARAFCRMGKTAQVLPLLIKELKNKDNKIARHYAALELEDIGDKVREFKEDIRAATNDDYDGVKRVTTRILNNLER